jgi:hypothetical protein
MMGGNRPILGCRQRVNFVGRWRIVQLEHSCPNFCPSGIFRWPRRSSNEDGKEDPTATRRIPLTCGQFALVDPEDYYRLSKFQWYANGHTKTKFYAIRKCDGKSVKMHRVIMNAPEDLFVDHIDHNGLNNTRGNLRLCTPAENSRNSGSNKGSTSKYKGVSWNRNVKKWCAQIRLNYKIHRIGHFEDEIAAAKAYDKKAAELHGEFACLNFPNAAEAASS